MPTKDRGRELRLSSSDDDLITEAAGLLGMSVSEFLLGRAVADAEAIVDAHRTSTGATSRSMTRCACTRWKTRRRDLSRTFVLVDDAAVVIGYYALSMGGVAKEDLPRRLGGGVPGYQIGMVLLARLAIDGGHHGQGLGRDLLIDAVVQAAAAGRHAAARFIAVGGSHRHAARRFYRRFDFQDVEGDEHGRMYIRIDEALATFEESRDADH